MNRLAVISRFNEDLDWVKQLKIPYLIYNKGNNNIPLPSIQIPNIGRESDTFLKYIIEQYHSLPEEIAFLQGNPFDHCRDTLFYLNERKINDIENYYQIENKLIYLLNDGDPDIPTECDIQGKPHHDGLPIKEILDLIGIDYKGPFLYSSGAQYIVSKYCILSKSLKWWENIYSIHTFNPLSPWVFERIWPLLYASEV